MNLTMKLWLFIISSTLAGLSLFFAATLLIGSFSKQGYTHVELQEIGHQLVRELEQINISSENFEEGFLPFFNQHPEIELEWFNTDGSLIYASNGRTDEYYFDEIMERFLNMPSNLWETGQDITLVFELGKVPNRQFLILSLPSEAMQSKQIYFYVRDNIDFVQLLLPLALFFMTLYGFALFFFSRMNRRLKNLNKAMNTMDASGSTVSLKDASKDEIGHLTRHFNRMSERIKKQVSQLRDDERKRNSLIANLSHDLRTPLTMIQGYAETLHSRIVQDEEEQNKYLEIIFRRSRYMNQLLEKLMETARLDNYKVRIRLEKTNLSELVRRIAADYVPLLENRQIFFDVHIPDEPSISLVDPYLIERAVRNLIDNALQYGGDYGYLGLDLNVKEQREIEIAVHDHGPGIPMEQQTLIFERFYRGSKGREGEGLGIGLSIVQEIAAVHEGSVLLNSEEQGETTFTLVLPHRKSAPTPSQVTDHIT